MTDELAARLRQARTEAGLSREHLAGKVGVSLATVTRWESGRTQRFSLETLTKVATATGKSVGWFFQETAA